MTQSTADAINSAISRSSKDIPRASQTDLTDENIFFKDVLNRLIWAPDEGPTIAFPLKWVYYIQ